jgi:hypothetical protein
MNSDEQSMIDNTRASLIEEVLEHAGTALRSLSRLCDDDARFEAAIDKIRAAARQEAPEPMVIAVRSFGAPEFLTLRDYTGRYVDSGQVDLEYVRLVLVGDGRPYVLNEDEATTAPEYVEVHSAIDLDLLRSEFDRLAGESDRWTTVDGRPRASRAPARPPGANFTAPGAQ